MTIRYGPGRVYWAPALGERWEPLGTLVCGTCRGTGRVMSPAKGVMDPCPFGCLELQHMAQGLACQPTRG
jgi:hypothetical protein